MVIVMKPGAREEDLREVIARVEALGYHPHVIRGTTRSVVAAVGDERGKARLQALEALAGVEKIVPILQPYKLASRETRPARTVVRVGALELGGDRLHVMAGPCSVESDRKSVV